MRGLPVSARVGIGLIVLCVAAGCGGRSGSSRKPEPDETRQAIVAFGEEKYRRLEEPEDAPAGRGAPPPERRWPPCDGPP